MKQEAGGNVEVSEGKLVWYNERENTVSCASVTKKYFFTARHWTGSASYDS